MKRILTAASKFIRWKTDRRHTTVWEKDKKGMIKLEPEEIKKNWEAVKNEAYSNILLPGAYKWFKDNVLKKKLEKISDSSYLSKLADALEKDEITLEEAQDLKDFNSFREDLYGDLNKRFTKPSKEAGQ